MKRTANIHGVGRFGPVAAVILLSGLVGCGDGEARGSEVRESGAPVTIVDSILPIEEEVRRFAEAAGPAPAMFRSEWDSVEELTIEFVRALAAHDTDFFAAAMVSPSEFIAFYFPNSVYTAPPYQMDPAIIWFQMTSRSDRGLGRALARFGDRRLEFVGLTCDPPIEEGPNRIRERCLIRFRDGDEEREMRLFGPVLEREGHVKFLTYGNDL